MAATIYRKGSCGSCAKRSGLRPRRDTLSSWVLGATPRDSRTRVGTVAHSVVAPLLSLSYFNRRLAETSTAIHAQFITVPEIESGRLRLAFDHAQILAAALGQVRSRRETTTLARRFCPAEFKIGQLREVNEAVGET